MSVDGFKETRGWRQGWVLRVAEPSHYVTTRMTFARDRRRPELHFASTHTDGRHNKVRHT